MHRSHVVARFTLALAAAALLAAPAAATTLVREGLEDLVRANEMVLQGRIVDLHSYWNAERNFIFTDVRVRAGHVLKGELGQPDRDMTFTLMGGTVGDITTLIIGGPDLVPGSEYLLFLNREDLPGRRGVLTVRGLVQGVFDVASVAGQRRAFSQAIHHPLVPDRDGMAEVPGGDRGLDLADMIAQIRTLADQR